jgi:hypothetical protein
MQKWTQKNQKGTLGVGVRFFYLSEIRSQRIYLVFKRMNVRNVKQVCLGVATSQSRESERRG